MSRQRFVSLLVAAVVVIGVALLIAMQRNGARDAGGGPQVVELLPGLAKSANDAMAVTLRKGSATPTVTLHKTGAVWTVAERADYPADVVKLRKLLAALLDAKIIEQKTSDPARFAVIGVQDPVDPAAPGLEIAVTTPAGRSGLIVGKATGQGNFVRLLGENRTFSVEPAISAETQPQYWIDARLLDVPSALVQSVEWHPAGGAGYALHRANPADNTYTLDGAPPGRKALDAHALAPSQSLLSGLNAEDVTPAGSIDFGMATRVIITLSDGTALTLTGVTAGDKHWLEVTSSKDAALNAKTAGRAFNIASYRYDAIFRPLDQLLEPLPPKPAPAPKAVPPAPAPVATPKPARRPAPPAAQ